MKGTSDDATCRVCGGILENPMEKQRGIHRDCSEKSGGGRVEK